MTTLQSINANLKKAGTGIKNFKEGIQLSIDLFINNYEGDLGQNSEPLQRILATVDGAGSQYGKLLRKYITDFSNLQATKTKKGGLSLHSKDGNPLGFVMEPTRSWYEKEESESETKEWSLSEALQKLIKKAEKEGLSKADVSKALSKM